MIGNIQILTSFFWVIVIMLISILTTKLLQLLMRFFSTSSQNTLPIYWNLFLGLFFWVGIFAIVSTRGLTMLLPIPALIIWLIKNLSLRQELSKKNSKMLGNETLFFLLCLFIQFSFFVFTLSDINGFVQYISGDFSIYYRMADRLNTFGVEAYNFNINEKVSLPSAYHFGDLWLYAMIQKFVDVNPSITFLVSFSVLSVTFSMGIYNYCTKLFSNFIISKHKLLFILMFSGLFTGFSFLMPPFLKQFVEPYTLSVFNWGKVMVLSTSLIGLFIIIKDKLWVNLAIITSIAGLLYINAIPAIFGAVFLLFLMLFLLKKQLKFSKWLQLQSIYVGITLFILLFLYKIVPIFFKVSDSVVTKKPHAFLQDISIMQYIKTGTNIFIGGWFQLVTILPYLLLAIVGLIITTGFKKSIRILLEIDYSIMFLVMLFVSGLLAWAVLYPMSVDTVQFFHNILAPIYVIAISIILGYLILVVSKPILYVPVIVLALFSAYISTKNIFYTSSADKNEWMFMSKYFEDEKVASPFLNIRSIKELSYWSRRTDYYIPLNILSYQWHDYHNISLNSPFIPLSKISVYGFEEENDIANSTFTTYYNGCKSKGINDVNQCALGFIKDYKVKYVSVSKDTILPDYLRPFLIDSINLTKSNYTIYKIKP